MVTYLGSEIVEIQDVATVTQTPPTSGTQYTVLDTTENVRIIGIAAKVIWTVQPTPLEVHGVFDGKPLLWDFDNPVSNTWYYTFMSPALLLNNQSLTATDPTTTRSFLLDGRSVKVSVETTGGTVQNLFGYVLFGKMK